MQYIVGVTSTHSVWPPGAAPRKPKPRANGRPPTRFVDPKYEPISIQALAENLPKSAFRRVSWREGNRGRQSSKFACLRVRPAEQHTKGRPQTKSIG